MHQCSHDTDGRQTSRASSAASPPHPVVRREAMPRSKSKGPPQDAEAWQRESHARISARAKERADSAAAPSYYGFEKLATRPIAALASGEPIAPGEAEERRAGEQAARYHFRTSQEGQMAAGFDPHRHSVVVCGRPVQVIRGEKIIGMHFPFYDILIFIFLCRRPVTCVSELIALIARVRYLRQCANRPDISRNRGLSVLGFHWSRSWC